MNRFRRPSRAVKSDCRKIRGDLIEFGKYRNPVVRYRILLCWIRLAIDLINVLIVERNFVFEKKL